MNTDDDFKITINDIEPKSHKLRPCSEGGHVFWHSARIESGKWPCLRGCGYVKETEG